MDKDKRIFEIFVSGFLLAFTLFLLYTSFTTSSKITVVEGLTSMAFPRAILYVQAVFCLFVLGNSTKAYLQEKKDREPVTENKKQDKRPLINNKVLFSLVLMIIYVLLWDYLGFILSTILFFTVEAKMLDIEKPLWKCILFGLLVAGFSYIVFGVIFQVSFPEPLFELLLG